MHSRAEETQQIPCLFSRQSRVYHLTPSRLHLLNKLQTLLSSHSEMDELLKHTRNTIVRSKITRTLLFVNRRKRFLKQMDLSPTESYILRRHHFSSCWSHQTSTRTSWSEYSSINCIMFSQDKRHRQSPCLNLLCNNNSRNLSISSHHLKRKNLVRLILEWLRCR